MSLSCEACGQYPFPSLQIWEQSHEQSGTHSNTPKHTVATHSPVSLRLKANALVAYVEGLKKELEAATKALESTQSLLAPIYQVPDDVLICIFQEVFTYPDGQRYRGFDVSPYTLVCRRWRSVIASYPKFWARISFPLAHHYTSYPEGQLAASLRRYTGVQLNRVGTVPLTVECFRGFPFATLLETFEPVVDQLSSLRLFPEYEDVEETTSFCSLRPNLSQLHLIMRQSTAEFEFDENPLTIDLARASKLCDVELELEYYLEELSLPWARLTTLKIHLGGGGSFDAHSVVAELERIESLDLDFGLEYEYRPVPDVIWPRVTLPRLRTMTLAAYSRDKFPFWLLQNSTVPALKCLNLTLWRGHQDLVRAMSTSQLWTIVDLRLALVDWSYFRVTPDVVEEVIDSLWGFKCLESFWFSAETPHSTERIFRRLSQSDPSKGYLFPRLGSLKVTAAPFEQDALASLRELLESRMSNVDVPACTRKALRTVFVSCIQKSYTPTKQVHRPQLYNDEVCSVEVVLEGESSDGFLKENMTIHRLS